jgi:TIR domain
VIFDRWHNANIGASVGRFISSIENADFILVVGTPLYRQKYDNEINPGGSVVAAEVDLIHSRLTGTEHQKKSVLPILLEGMEANSFPPLMRGRVYADFRNESSYFSVLFDLVLTLYSIPFDNPAVSDLRGDLVSKNR